MWSGSGNGGHDWARLEKKGILSYLFRVPVYVYRGHLGWLFGKRLLMLSETGRRTGLRRHTVLEVVEYRKEGPEVVVANGFGADSDWLRNIQAKSDEEVTVGSQHFAASHRFLGEGEAVASSDVTSTATGLLLRSSAQVLAGCWGGNIALARVSAID